MLILARKPNEEVIIGKGESLIKITVVQIVGGKVVRLGFEAPKDVPIHRKEVFDKIQESKGK